MRIMAWGQKANVTAACRDLRNPKLGQLLLSAFFNKAVASKPVNTKVTSFMSHSNHFNGDVKLSFNL